jgi:hypothetical protein
MIGAANSVSHLRSSSGSALIFSDSESGLTGLAGGAAGVEGTVCVFLARTRSGTFCAAIGFARGSDTLARRCQIASRPSVETAGPFVM